jgi:hypothetical protein
VFYWEPIGVDMKVGDLVRHIPSSGLGLIIEEEHYSQDEWSWTLVKWFDELGEVEHVGLYEGELEVISESR